HFVCFFFFLASSACVVKSVKDFSRETFFHCFFSAFSAVGCKPSKAKSTSSVRSDVHRHLICRTADTASLNFKNRHNVVKRLLKYFKRISACLFLYSFKRTIYNFLSNTLLAVKHDAVNELCYKCAVV